MTIPNLAGVIKKDDIYQKGGGSFKASYVAWAKTSQLLREHAEGWFFYLAAKNEEYVWSAPDGTGYLMCFFQYENNYGDQPPNPAAKQRTPLLPLPIMDNRNMPVKLEKISSRILTDSHRRALCACACFTFGLAFEIWADEEVLEAGVQPEKSKVSNVQPKNSGPLKNLFISSIKKATTEEELLDLRSKIDARHAAKALTDADRDEILKLL